MVSKVEVTYLYTHSSPALSFGLYIFCVVNPYPDPGTRLWPIEVAEQGVLPYCICHKVGNRRRFPLVARSLYPELRRKFAPLILALSTVTGPIKEEMFVPPNFVSVPQEPIRRVVSYYTSINSNEVRLWQGGAKRKHRHYDRQRSERRLRAEQSLQRSPVLKWKDSWGGWRIVSSK
jgi:hypothetical protein